MSDSSVTTVDFMRHGEPVGGRRYRGQTDDPLSEKGWQQMRAAVGGECPWDLIVTSPLVRCSAFARELAQRHDRQCFEDARLVELGYGEWEGRTPEEITRHDARALERFFDDPVAHAPAGAEQLTGFLARIGAAWADLLSAHAGRSVLVVGHAGTIRAALAHALELPMRSMFRVHVPTASFTRLRVEQREGRRAPRLLFHARSPISP